jgi:hypothetical protein
MLTMIEILERAKLRKGQRVDCRCGEKMLEGQSLNDDLMLGSRDFPILPRFGLFRSLVLVSIL